VRDIKVGFWDSAGFLRLSLRSGYANRNGSSPAERDTVSSRRCKPTDLNAEHFRPWRGRTLVLCLSNRFTDVAPPFRAACRAKARRYEGVGSPRDCKGS
jgi:hypothetical protein